ncbi:NAD(P)/FAD-dependent oxidoreductase [Rhodobacteraceae bacterium D3-12]|nr:NAD(P)/FAD-dependent oxidoreductase [Rhodobacteraceae bacterium D3-12]
MANESPNTHMQVDAVIVGAGIAGMYAIHRLTQMGLSVCAFERGDGVGGTWYWNRYPGARCDVESLEYCYSFSEELVQEWSWKDRYADQSEILSYLDHVADRFDLRRHIQFETEIESAVYNDETALWTLTTNQGTSVSARYCVMATGNLSKPQFPAVPGLERFKGALHHTGAWPKDGLDFTGKRVVQIGTGATGIQVAPRIAPQAEALIVLQRTANFSIPAGQRPLPDEAQQEFRASFPVKLDLALNAASGMAYVPVPEQSALDVTEEERNRIYEERWQNGGSFAFSSSFNDILTDFEANQTAANFVRGKIRSIVKDPETAEALCPKDHPYATKRVCVDSGYYATFNRDNVTLVDLNVEKLLEFTENGFRTSKKEYEVDAAVFATGFDAITGAVLEMDVRGKGGLSLRDAWNDAPTAYLGLQAAGFPNLFFVTGPGSPSVKANMFKAIEQHVDWIADCIRDMREQGIVSIEADASAEAEWVAHVKDLADSTLYPLAKSWWTGANVPGKPRHFMIYIGGFSTYRQLCFDVAENGYKGFHLEKEPEVCT